MAIRRSSSTGALTKVKTYRADASHKDGERKHSQHRHNGYAVQHRLSVSANGKCDTFGRHPSSLRAHSCGGNGLLHPAVGNGWCGTDKMLVGDGRSPAPSCVDTLSIGGASDLSDYQRQAAAYVAGGGGRPPAKSSLVAEVVEAELSLVALASSLFFAVVSPRRRPHYVLFHLAVVAPVFVAFTALLSFWVALAVLVAHFVMPADGETHAHSPQPNCDYLASTESLAPTEHSAKGAASQCVLSYYWCKSSEFAPQRILHADGKVK